MHAEYATRQTFIATTLTFCSAVLFAQCLTHAQDRGGFQFSPAHRNTANQDTDSSEDRKLAPFNMNDLRAPNPASEIQTQQNTLAPLQPRRDISTNQGPSSILERSGQQLESLNDQRQLPKFNAQEFELPPINRDGDNLLQPLQASPRVSPESFRLSDLNQGDVRTVSATMQDDGRSTALGTQPLGSTAQTQTVQQQGGFSLRNQQPAANQNPGGQLNLDTNGAQAGGQTPFTVTDPTPVQLQPVQQQLQPQNRGVQGMQNQGMGLNQPTNGQRLAAGQPNNGIGTNLAPATQPAPKVDTSIARSLMRQYSIDTAAQPLPGQPTSIREMLELTTFQNRPAMVDQYWNTYQAWCDMMCCEQQVNALSQIVPPNNPAEKNLLSTANSIARNELLDAEIQLAKAQARLQRFIPNSQNELVLPLPSDQPIISSYSTFYDYYSSRRDIPNEIRNIATSLPKMLMLVSQRAETARDSQNSMQQIRQFVQGGQAPVSEVLQAVRMWSESNKQVVNSVVDYNRSIAAYSLNVMGSRKSPDQMAIALVGKPKPQTADQQPAVRQATLPAELRGQGMNSRAGQTFNARPGSMQPSNNMMNNQRGTSGNLGNGNLNGGNQQNFRTPNAGGTFRGN